MNINELQAGPELDDLVAERACGFVIDRFTFEYDGMFKKCRVWVDNEGKKHNPKPYSTDIAAAWEVVEKMRELGWWIGIETVRGGDEWSVQMGSRRELISGPLPLCVCRAALLAVGGGE